MSTQWTPIRITGLDTSKTAQSPTASGLRLMYLTLSDTPPNEWVELFEAERAFPRHSMWRSARVIGTHIEIDCVPEELEKHHLADLKQDVASANKKFDEWAKREGERLLREVEEDHAERKRINDIANRLKFD
jgi:hypothetical protein